MIQTCEISPGPATVVVRANGAVSPAAAISVRQAGPGVFTNAQGQAAARNDDQSVNSPQHPAAPGRVVSIYFTGFGPLSAALDDGAGAPVTPLIRSTAQVSVTIGGVPALIRYAGLAPNYAGLGQLNVEIPALPGGTYPVVVTIAGAAGNSALISIAAP